MTKIPPIFLSAASSNPPADCAVGVRFFCLFISTAFWVIWKWFINQFVWSLPPTAIPQFDFCGDILQPIAEPSSQPSWRPPSQPTCFTTQKLSVPTSQPTPIQAHFSNHHHPHSSHANAPTICPPSSLNFPSNRHISSVKSSK